MSSQVDFQATGQNITACACPTYVLAQAYAGILRTPKWSQGIDTFNVKLLKYWWVEFG